MGREQKPKRRLFAFDRIDLPADHQRHADGLGQAAGGAAVFGPKNLDLAEFDRQLGPAGGATRGGGKLHRHGAGLVPRVGLGEQSRPVGQRAILSRPHQLFHVGRLEREAFIDVAFAVFDHRDAGRAGFGQGAGAFCARQPAAAILLLERPLPALVAFAALTREKEIVDKAEHRPCIGVHCDDRMKRQTEAFLVHAQGRGVLNGEHVPADHLGAGARPGRSHHLVSCHLGIVQKPPNPHLAGATAAQPPDADALAAMRDKPLKQERPPFSRRSSPNSPSVSSIPASRARITAIGSQVDSHRASAKRCVNIVGLDPRVHGSPGHPRAATRGRR